MDRAMPDTPTSPDARMLAALMLDCAREDLSLLTRSRGGRNGRLMRHDPQGAPGEPNAPLVLETKSELAAQQHLEDLVSIAVTSAQQADEAVQRACQASATTRRSIWALAGISVLGVILGIVGFASGQLSAGEDGRLIAMAKDVQNLSNQQRQTHAELTVVRSEVAASQATGATAVEVPSPSKIPAESQEWTTSVSERTLQTGLKTPTSTSLRPVTYGSLWPSHSQPTRQASARPDRRVVLPPFFVTLRQNMRAMFR